MKQLFHSVQQSAPAAALNNRASTMANSNNNNNENEAMPTGFV